MTPEEYKALYTFKHKRNYKAEEDRIILSDIVPHLNLWTNSKRLSSYWTKIVNEELTKSIQVGVKLKRMGKKAGIADYIFLKDGRYYFIEVKQPRGKQSEAQKEFEKYCIEDGGCYSMCHDSKEVESVLKQWGILK